MYIVALYILYIGGKDNVYIFVQRIRVLNFNIAVDISLFPATQSFFFFFFLQNIKYKGITKLFVTTSIFVVVNFYWSWVFNNRFYQSQCFINQHDNIINTFKQMNSHIIYGSNKAHKKRRIEILFKEHNTQDDINLR